MSKRSAQFVAALTVSVLAGANLATVTDLRAQAATADDCLTAPKPVTTPGGHWYYRLLLGKGVPNANAVSFHKSAEQ